MRSGVLSHEAAALDTSSTACSVAVQVDDNVIEKHEEQAREHTRLLLPMISAATDAAGVALADLDAIVLGNGPGSFIGVRIAASVAQGLAFGSGLTIVPVSSMLAVAEEAILQHDATEVIVAQDAHMEQVYLGIYRGDAAGCVTAVGEERIHDQGEIAELAQNSGGMRVAAGAGWQRYPGLFTSNEHRIDELSDIRHPRAIHLLAAGASRLAAGLAIPPEQVTPAYLRQKVAKKPAKKQA